MDVGTRWGKLVGSVLSVLLGAATLGCGGNPSPADGGPTDAGPPPVDSGTDAGPPDSGPPPEDCEGPPGLYAPGSCTVLAEGVRPYQPRFSLWTDGADKERFIYLPPGTQIDTRDPDHWVFPIGTRIYKTFAYDGVLVETRVFVKEQLGTGPIVWDMRTYAWNAEQDAVRDVTNEPLSLRENVLGTEHDIPSGAQCQECHSSSLDATNSFTAIQLNHDLGGVTLADLRNEGLMTHDIEPGMAGIPGTPAEVEALGYLHANCGNCHRQTPPGEGCVGAGCASGLLLWVNVGVPSVEATSTYQTAVGVPGGYPLPSVTGACRVHPGQPDMSTLVYRMAQRGTSAQMPPLGTELAHSAGIDVVRAWIAGLRADASSCPPP